MNEITLLAFAAVAFIGIATPGPTVLLGSPPCAPWAATSASFFLIAELSAPR